MNASRDDWNKMLWVGVIQGEPETARAALEGGANPNFEAGDWDRSPIFVLACAFDLGLVDLFIEKGVDLTAVDFQGNTALHLSREPEVVERLLAAKASPHARNFKGETPLHFAGNRDSAQLLVDGGADPLAASETGLLPWQTQEKWLAVGVDSGRISAEGAVALRGTVDWLRAEAQHRALQLSASQVTQTAADRHAQAERERD